MAGLIALRVPIVNLLLERGQFDWISTAGTATAILYYALGLWAFAGVRIVAQAFYSLQDTRTPVKVAVVALVANVLFSVILMKPLEHGGLALATSLAAMINIFLLTKKLRKKIGRMDGRRIARSLLKIIPTSAAMGLIGWWISLDPAWGGVGNNLYKTGLLCGGMIASVVFYILVMWLLKSEELAFLWGMVKRRRKA
jgi:putative peptidoglycan lipid II flippase